MLDEKRMYGEYCVRKVAGAIKYLVTAKGLNIECTRVLRESMLPLLIYSSETMAWNMMYRFKMQSVQMDNVWGVLGMLRINKMRNDPRVCLWA